MILDGIILALFGAAVLFAAVRLARRDALYAAMMVFFLIYTIFAMVGYRYFPVLSQLLNAYFGLGVYDAYLRFVVASFVAYFVAVRALHPVLVGERLSEVRYEPVLVTRWAALLLVAALVGWMGVTLARIYAGISYGGTPQIPHFLYAVLFKNSIFVLLLLWAFARFFAQSTLERVMAWALVVALLTIFLLTALKASNRTDILALILGLTWLELAPLILDDHWRLRVRLDRVLVMRLFALVAAVTAAWALMEFISATRRPVGADAIAIPIYFRVLLNDYYAPAHILIATIAHDYVRPLLVLKSTIANALLVGGVLDVPYPQTEIGNMLIPGSSSRSTGFAYYIFTEGYMAAGPWLGAIYNGLVTVLCLALWRRLGRTTDPRYNALVGALCAMSLATVARSGNYLTIRIYLFTLLPYLFAFRVIAGAKLSPPRPTPDPE